MAKGSGGGAGEGGGSGGRAAPAPQVQDFTGQANSSNRYRRDSYSRNQARFAQDLADEIRRATGQSARQLLNNYSINVLIQIRDAIRAGKQVKV